VPVGSEPKRFNPGPDVVERLRRSPQNARVLSIGVRPRGDGRGDGTRGRRGCQHNETGSRWPTQAVDECRRVTQPRQHHGRAQGNRNRDHCVQRHRITDHGCGSGPQRYRNGEMYEHQTASIPPAGVWAPPSRQGQQPKGRNQSRQSGNDRCEPYPICRKIMKTEPANQVTVVAVHKGQPGDSYDGSRPGHLDQQQLGEQRSLSWKQWDEGCRQKHWKDQRSEPVSRSGWQRRKVEDGLIDQRPDLTIDREAETDPVASAGKSAESLAEDCRHQNCRECCGCGCPGERDHRRRADFGFGLHRSACYHDGRYEGETYVSTGVSRCRNTRTRERVTTGCPSAP